MTPEQMLTEAERALGRLKDFQRATVDHVFDRLFAAGSTRRFLVADEVGLGKTMIAKGVIAKAIQHLQGKVDRIDVVYICSNGDIARQNLNRLHMAGASWTPASRLTMLAKHAERFDQKLNFVSFTPGTSFDIDSGLGHVEERVLLYQLLEQVWGFDGGVAPLNVLAGHTKAERFRDYVRTAQPLDEKIAKPLRTKLGQLSGAQAEFRALCESYPTARSKPPYEVRVRRNKLVGSLRIALATSCIATLEPDLIILDEFQRFTHLLEGESEASHLAKALFDWPDAHVLLLSATPYKMYTTANEAAGDDHYAEFLKTIRFLERRSADDPAVHSLSEYRSALERVLDVGGEARLDQARRALEQRLHSVMVRTERLAATPDRNGMLKAMPPAGDLEKADVLDYLALQRTAQTLEQQDNVLEYWKSSPFVLNFMDAGYKLKEKLSDAAAEPESRGAVARALATSKTSCLSFQQHDAFEALGLQNGRFRQLVQDTVDRGAHRLLWIPPASPYYALGGAFREPALGGFTKRLIFSAWRFVPRAVAALLSYEAERRMVQRSGEGTNTPEQRKKRGRLLRFGQTESGGPANMSTLALLYPSSFLARACDPVRLAAESLSGPGAPTQQSVSDAAKTQIELALRRLPSGDQSAPVDERWYWAAPLLLDGTLEPGATGQWFEQKDLAAIWSGEKEVEQDDESVEEGDNKLWRLHVERAREVALGRGEQLGKRPDDLASSLAELALGAPGVTLLRSMLRVVNLRPEALGKDGATNVRNGAAQAAWSFRALFNQAEVVDLLRREYPSEAETGYWRAVLRYCVDGCLQAVLDEYTHVLRDHLGLGVGSGPIGDRVHGIAEEISSALSLRTANLAVDDLGLSAAGRTLAPSKRHMRCHFALRFGDERDEDGEIQTRSDSVRKAFNSPFWPFVVATTSVGQEGLDFHTYCHAVVHWNLPSNPIDLEQREGRVHRFKGHAVRKNIAAAHLSGALATEAIDPWQAMFDAAEEASPPGSTHITPYWVYTGDAHIERHVWAHPLSRDTTRLHALLKSLTIYRMAFGQPRQDDLLRYLQEKLPQAELERIAALAAIDISPGNFLQGSGAGRSAPPAAG